MMDKCGRKVSRDMDDVEVWLSGKEVIGGKDHRWYRVEGLSSLVDHFHGGIRWLNKNSHGPYEPH